MNRPLKLASSDARLGGGRDWRRADLRHDVPLWRLGIGPELRRHLHRLALGAMEEAGQYLVVVLGGENLRQLGDARDAQAPVPERLDDLGDAPDELGGDLPVVGSALREPELTVEEHEQAGVAELDPEPVPVEVGESEKEIGHGAVLAGEQVGEASGECACGVHARMVS